MKKRAAEEPIAEMNPADANVAGKTERARELIAKMNSADTKVARQLLDWSCEFFNDIHISQWLIIPKLRVGSIVFGPLVIQRYIQEYKKRGDGAVYVDIRNIQRTAPFNDKKNWDDLKRKLISAPIRAKRTPINEPNPEGNYYRIEYSQLDSNTLAAFQELIASSVEQVKNAAQAQ